MQRLIIANFRSLKSVDVKLGKVNIFAGRNNQGKSSILEAIKFVFNGYNIWTSKKGDGYKNLIQKGQKAAVITLETGFGEIVRTLPGKLFLDGNSEKFTEAEILSRLGVTTKNLGALTDFMSLKPQEQIDLLTSVSEGNTKPWEDYFLAELKLNPNLNIQPQDLVTYLENILPPQSSSLAPAAVLNYIEEAARKERYAANKVVKDKKAVLLNLPVVPDFLEAESKEEIQEKLKAKRQERDQLLMLIAKNDEAKKKLKRREELKGIINSLQQKLKLIENENVDIEKWRVGINTVNQTIRDAENELAKIEQHGKTLKSFYQKLEKFIEHPQCPIAPGINCKLEQKEVANILQEFTQSIQEAREQYKAIQQIRTNALHERERFENELHKAEQVLQSQKLIGQQLQIYQEELQSLENLPTPAPDDELKIKESSLVNEIETLEKRLEEIQKKRRYKK